MPNTSKIEMLSERDIFYYRRRLQNNVYNDVLVRFVELAKKEGLTKRRIAQALGKDEGQLSRLFSEPANWTLATISDLLLAMHAELSHEVVSIDGQEQLNEATASSSHILQLSNQKSVEPPATERYFATS